MTYLIWIGAAITFAGLGLLVYTIWQVVAAKRAGLDSAAMKAALQRAVAFNMGALALSGLGLMMVVVGVILA